RIQVESGCDRRAARAIRRIVAAASAARCDRTREARTLPEAVRRVCPGWKGFAGVRDVSVVVARMHYIVVRRADFQGYDTLHKAFGQKVPVIWERRHTDRRQNANSTCEQARRYIRRRGAPPARGRGPGWLPVEREE